MLGIFLDSETNGLNVHRHQLIEIAFKILDVLTGELKDEFTSVVSTSVAQWAQSDPESLQVNGFTWDEVAHGTPPSGVGMQIERCFAKHAIKRGEAVFICQNPSFDRAFFGQLVDPDRQERLFWPYHWLDLASMYWVEGMHKGVAGMGKFPWETGLSKDKIAKTYQLPPEEKPHRAMNGVNHLIQCYAAVVGFPHKK